jgi:hypothetical protein
MGKGAAACRPVIVKVVGGIRRRMSCGMKGSRIVLMSAVEK